MLEITNNMLEILKNAKNRLRNFKETGIDLPIIQFNPVGDTVKIFSNYLRKHS